jgi:cobalamin synthase
MALAREIGGAGAFALGRPALVAAWPASDRIPALAWLPAVGLGVGAAAAAVAHAVEPLGTGPAALAAALALSIAHGPPRRWDVRLAGATVSAAALAGLAPAARALALVVAPMLARWAAVVQCYGGVPRPGADGLAALAGRARFREFAIASVTALGTSLVVLDAVGLALAAVCALVTMALRVGAYRKAGGIGDETLDATSALVETSALVLLVWIGSVLGPAR